MLKKVANQVKRSKKAIFSVFAMVAVMAVTTVTAFADVTTPTSLLNDTAMGFVNDFAADIVPTVLALIAIIIPVGLSLWAISLGVKKGLGALKKAARRSV